MTYSTSSVILANDYNIFAQGSAGSPVHTTANVNSVWGVGNGNKGYGQTTLPILSTVTGGSTVVTATQWATMLNRISSSASHQGTSITAITNPVANDTISAYSALSTNISSIYNSRLNCSAVGSDITTGGTSSFASAWSTAVTHTHTITFASGDAARYFFNTGGRIVLSFSQSGGSSIYNAAIASLMSAAGTLHISADSAITQTIAGASYAGTTKTGGSGSPTITSTGYYNLTTSNVQIMSQSASTYYGYESDSITVNIKSNGAQGSNGDNGSVITIYVRVGEVNTAAGNRTGGATYSHDGTLSSVCLLRPSETTYTTTTSWGTPTISSSNTGS